MSIDGVRELLLGWWRHGFRTAVTAASVAWGIFMLVVLLAAGQGLENNLRWQFRDDAVNSLWIYPGKTTLPFQGQGRGRWVEMEDADYEWMGELADVVDITGRFYPQGDTTMAWKQRTGNFSIRAVHPGHQAIEQTIMLKGRYINALDLRDKRKVAVIGEKVESFLFEGADAMGEQLRIGNLSYRVVGVFTDLGGVRETQQVYIPITTAQTAYGAGRLIDQMMFTVPPELSAAASVGVDLEVRKGLARRYIFDPEDQGAVRVRNNVQRFEDVQKVFIWLRGFVWLVGLGTVAAGVVGVSNIMLISVKERTRELGLRKALGATPGQLVRMIVAEAVLLTAASGYAGLVAGVAVVEGVRRYLPENEYLRDPRVDLGAVVSALVLLIIAGTIAGFIPARKAAAVPPTEALRA